MFRLKLKVYKGCNGLSHSLLIHNPNAGNDLHYTIDSVRGRNIAGPHLLYYGKVINVSGLTDESNSKKRENMTIVTPTDAARDITLRQTKFQVQNGYTNIGGASFPPGWILQYGFTNNYKKLYDENAEQHIYLGKKILIHGDVSDKKYDNVKRKFPSILLQQKFDPDSTYFQLKYTDDSSREITNEQIEIICELYRD